VVGAAGFFSAFFVGGNVLVHKWGEFWKVSTQTTLSQRDTTHTQVQQVVDSQEDARDVWKEAEPKP